MKQYIYADNAATTQLDIEAFEAMKPLLLTEYGNASQPYSFSRGVRKDLQKARTTIAECIGASPEEIFFTSGGTESDNWAIKGTAFAASPELVTVTSQIEHHAVLNSCKNLEQLGYPVVYLPVASNGSVEATDLKANLTKMAGLVSIMLANNEIGTVQPIDKLCAIAHSCGAYFHTDAVQAVGHIKIDVQLLGIDLLSASAHKFNGPKGIGFLYIKKGTKIRAYVSGGVQEYGLRAGTENVASIVGMAVALKNSCAGIETNTHKLNQLEKILLSELTTADYIRNGDAHNHLPGNISLSFNGADGEAILHRLDLKGILISTGAACDSANSQVSHVIKAIGVAEKYAKGTIRISLGKHNTEAEVIAIAKALKQIVDPV